MTEYIDSSGALAVRVKETKNIRIKATELLSMVVLSKGTGLEMDEETVFNSLGQTNLVGSDKVAYSTIVINNDMSALDDGQEEEVALETEEKEDDGGIWGKIGKAVAITAAVVAVAAVADYCDDGEFNLGVGEYIKSGLKGAVTGAIAGGIGSAVSSLGVVARIGIEGTSDFIVDIGDQLISSGLNLSEISLGEAAKNALLGIVIGETASKYGEPLFRNLKGAAVKFHTNVATPFNDFVADGVDKIGKTVFDTLGNVAKSINPNGGLQPSIAGMNLNGFDSGNSFKDIDFSALKDKTFNFIKGDGGGSGTKSVSGKAVTGTVKGKYQVGTYQDIKGVKGLDAHHAGQKAVMKNLVENYDPKIAPAINVPKVGHTISGPNGIISRSTKGIESARQLLARDIMELRRVYKDIPNSALQELIELNKKMYREMRGK